MAQFVKAVLFDLDGTLIDTAADFVRIIGKMSRENNWQVPDEDAIREQVSAGASAMVKLMLGHNNQTNVSEEDLLAFRQQFLDDYEADICVDSGVFTELDEILAMLEERGIPWGIVTNKPRYLSELLLQALQLDKRCTVLVCPDDVTHTKPDPEPMYLALEKLGIPRGGAASVLYIGDHIRDIDAGNSAGMTTILAAYGYIPPEDQKSIKRWGADYIAETPKKLNQLLLASDKFEYLQFEYLQFQYLSFEQLLQTLTFNIIAVSNPMTDHTNNVAKQNNNKDHTQDTAPTLTHDDIRTFLPTNNCLKDKTILVTGAGAGIGRVAALTYARYGATVLLLGRTSSKLEAVYDEIESLGGKQPAVLPMDLETASYNDMQQLANLIIKEIGQLDGILHNAGILGELTPLEMYDVDTFAKVMYVNTTATFMLTQALLPLLKESKNGSIIFTSSTVGTHPRAFWGAYALSKQALEGMSDIFTQETQNTTDLRFNCINPGGTRTNMRAHAFPGENPMTLKTPEDIMPGYVCLMSDASIGVRGQVVALQPKG